MNNITLTYLNIRQSISILVAKLIATDFIVAFIVVSFCYVLVLGEKFALTISRNTTLFLSAFAVLGAIKIALTIYTVLQWLYEYYEITPENIVHKHGLIFRQTEMYDLDKIRIMDVQDTFLGELFNFATIVLYDIRLNRYLDMYLIHNPQRYAHVLQQLCPNIEIREDRVKVPFMQKKELIKQHI